jgi:ribose-phosphate pyrophosphokinase
MITLMGVDRVMSLDLHSGQIQGFFGNVPLDNLSFMHEFAQHVRLQSWFSPESTVVVSPDAGGVERAKQLADILAVGRIVTIVKRRIKAGQVETMQTVGEVDGLHCVIVDDMIDTGGTLVKACELLKALGAVSVTACCTHGILTNPATERVNKCEALMQLVVSDSIPQQNHMEVIPKLVVLSIAPLLASAIVKSANNQSVSSLFSGPLKSRRTSAAE